MTASYAKVFVPTIVPDLDEKSIQERASLTAKLHAADKHFDPQQTVELMKKLSEAKTTQAELSSAIDDFCKLSELYEKTHVNKLCCLVSAFSLMLKFDYLASPKIRDAQEIIETHHAIMGLTKSALAQDDIDKLVNFVIQFFDCNYEITKNISLFNNRVLLAILEMHQNPPNWILREKTICAVLCAKSLLVKSSSSSVIGLLEQKSIGDEQNKSGIYFEKLKTILILMLEKNKNNVDVLKFALWATGASLEKNPMNYVYKKIEEIQAHSSPEYQRETFPVRFNFLYHLVQRTRQPNDLKEARELIQKMKQQLAEGLDEPSDKAAIIYYEEAVVYATEGNMLSEINSWKLAMARLPSVIHENYGFKLSQVSLAQCFTKAVAKLCQACDAEVVAVAHDVLVKWVNEAIALNRHYKEDSDFFKDSAWASIMVVLFLKRGDILLFQKKPQCIPDYEEALRLFKLSKFNNPGYVKYIEEKIQYATNALVFPPLPKKLVGSSEQKPVSTRAKKKKSGAGGGGSDAKAVIKSEVDPVAEKHNQEIKKIQAELQAQKAVSEAEIKKLQDKLGRTKSYCKAQELELKEAREIAQTAQGQEEKIREDLARLTMQYDSQSTKLEEAKKDTEMARAVIKRMEGELSQLTVDYAEAKKQTDEAEKNAGKALERASAAETLALQSQRKANVATAKIKEIKRETKDRIKEMETEKNTMIKEHVDQAQRIKAEAKEIVDDLKAAESRALFLQNEASRIQAALVNDNESLMQDNEQLRKENRTLAQALDDARNKVQQLTAQLPQTPTSQSHFPRVVGPAVAQQPHHQQYSGAAGFGAGARLFGALQKGVRAPFSLVQDSDSAPDAVPGGQSLLV